MDSMKAWYDATTKARASLETATRRLEAFEASGEAQTGETFKALVADYEVARRRLTAAFVEQQLAAIEIGRLATARAVIATPAAATAPAVPPPAPAPVKAAAPATAPAKSSPAAPRRAPVASASAPPPAAPASNGWDEVIERSNARLGLTAH